MLANRFKRRALRNVVKFCRYFNFDFAIHIALRNVFSRSVCYPGTLKFAAPEPRVCLPAQVADSIMLVELIAKRQAV